MTRLAVAALVSAAFAGCSATRPVRPPAAGGSPVVTARAAAPDAAAPDPADVRALEKTLRDLLLANLPDPVVQTGTGWGHQSEGVVGVKFHRAGPRLWSEPVKGLRNDGAWRRVTVRAADPAKTLAVGVTEAAFPEPGRATFTAMIGADCGLRFEQQLWKNGARLYGGETRGRCRAAVLLRCEVTTRTEPKADSFIPDLVLRVRVIDARLFYENVVIEHTAGVGGDAAKVLGEAFLDTVKRVKPDLERDLLARANAAIVKAADSKEIRVSVAALFKGGAVVEKPK